MNYKYYYHYTSNTDRPHAFKNLTNHSSLTTSSEHWGQWRRKCVAIRIKASFLSISGHSLASGSWLSAGDMLGELAEGGGEVYGVLVHHGCQLTVHLSSNSIKIFNAHACTNLQ
jgi:hypothetical protein